MARAGLITEIEETDEAPTAIKPEDLQDEIEHIEVTRGEDEDEPKPKKRVDEEESEEDSDGDPKDEAEEEEEFEEELQPTPDDDDDKTLTMRDRVFRERRTAAERQSEVEARLFDAETKGLTAELRGVAGDIKSFDADLATYRLQLAEAKEKGDTKAEIDLTDKLADVRVAKLDAERTKRDLESKVEERKKASFNPAEQAFLKLNPWFTDKERYRGAKYDKLRSSTIQLDRQLGTENTLDSRTHDYFRELDVRLRKKHPDVFGKRAEQQKRSTVGGVRSSPGAGKATGGGGAGSVLSQRMEALGMNPRDPKQVAAWRNAERNMKK